jgi:uncharacterized protein (TIGR02246 family)
MSKRRMRLALVFLLFVGFLGTLGIMSSTLTRFTDAAEPKKAEPPADDKDGRKADRAGIQMQNDSFVKAFQRGDAESVASFWTADGEFTGDDGRVYRGRAAIARAYRELFGTKEKRQLVMEMESLRSPSRDTAIEEGYFKVRVGDGEPAATRYSILHVREGGKWLMAVVREWQAEAVSLRDLEWLIGTWVAKRDDAEVQTTYAWLWDKSFLRVEFTIHQQDRDLKGFQMIGEDATSGGLRSWTFESEGGFGEATWTRDGKKWVLDSTGRLADGKTLAATNLLIPLDADSFIWQTVKRSVNGEEVDDLPPVKVTRVKAKK